MARTLKFKASDSPDVVTYKLYVEEAPADVTYNSENMGLGNDVNTEGYIIVDMSKLQPLVTKDGIYNIGITAVDDAGNESSMAKASNVPLDFVAPNPPTDLELY